MTERRYLYVTQGMSAEPKFSIYHDERMRPHLEKAVTVIYKTELLGRWRDASLTEIIAEYRRVKAETGQPPPSNLKGPPAAKGREERIGRADPLPKSSQAIAREAGHA